MAFQIKGVDLNPYGGDAWMGLTRSQAKAVALVFIVVGLNLADFFTPIPNDFLNVGLAAWLTTHYPSQTPTTWLLLTYTVIAWSLILIGAWIYPHNTHSLLNGYVNKFQELLQKLFRNPVYLGLTVLVLYLTYQWYGKVVT